MYTHYTHIFVVLIILIHLIENQSKKGVEVEHLWESNLEVEVQDI